MRLAICVATMQSRAASIIGNDLQNNVPGQIRTWVEHLADTSISDRIYILRNDAQCNHGVVGSYQKLYEQSHEDILLYLHDDVICRERNWDTRLLNEFKDK